MDHTYFSVMLGTIFFLLAYIYFYVLYRERYMGIWIISWGIFFTRILFFDYGFFNWKVSVLGFTIYQALISLNGLMFVWGTYIFINKPYKRYWLYGGIGVFLVSFTFTVMSMPMLYKLLPPLLYGGAILIKTGLIFIRKLPIKGIGNQLTGYAFIGWGLLTILMPYTITIAWLSPWCYLAAGYLRLIIALGILLVYFEKTRSDLALKESQYRLLAENAVDVIYRYRLIPDAGFEYISPSVFVATGYTSEEYYSDARLLFNLIHPEDLRLFENFVQAPSSAYDLLLTFRLIRKDQNIIWLEQKSVPIYDQEGQLLALEGILRDITARKNMEQIVARAEQMNLVGQMAVSVAHELRNPLTSVRGYLQLMRLKAPNNDYRDRYDLMIEELDRTGQIVSEYLLLAKDKVSNLKVGCLNKIITTLYPLMQIAATAARVSLTLALEEIPDLYLDENEIRQLLFNLVNNGLEAMTAGGELRIQTFVACDKVVLAVSDQGSGIDKHILDNLGTPFLTNKDFGTGLGLPICYRIANRHHAAIEVETSSQGTTFCVKFVLAEPAA